VSKQLSFNFRDMEPGTKRLALTVRNLTRLRFEAKRRGNFEIVRQCDERIEELMTELTALGNGSSF
jgi:hypothetical protein